jgi:glycerophosphoryl diester phosphodiesterase
MSILDSMRWLIVLLTALPAWAQPHVAVISHRGEHLHHPENTIAAFQAAVEAGADFFELDVRTTADGKFVLMHDATVDRMTNGKGDVDKMTFEQIRALEVGVKMDPKFAGTRVPTFEEALRFAHGKIGVYVDSKKISAADVVAMLEKCDMSERVVIYGGAGYLKEVAALRPKLKVMPEAGNVDRLSAFLKDIPLKVVAFDKSDFLDPVIALARDAKADIYVDRLADADNPTAWLDAVKRGATGIQTDHPAELVAFLRSQGFR